MDISIFVFYIIIKDLCSNVHIFDCIFLGLFLIENCMNTYLNYQKSILIPNNNNTSCCFPQINGSGEHKLQF